MMTTSARRPLLLCLILVILLFTPMAAVAQEGIEGPEANPSPELVAPIYQERCANCHGASGQGDGSQAIQAGIRMPDLTDPKILRETTPANWFDIISNGIEGEAMPPFGEASSNPIRQIDRWNLVFFLYTLGTPSAQVAMGQALYERSCAECHGTEGAGSEEAPGFTDLAAMANRSQADLFTNIQEHELGLSEVEVWTLADYVRTFSYNYAPPDAVSAPSTAVEPAASSPFTGGIGVVDGRVINGTAGSAPPDGAVIQLRAFDMDANFVDAITTTVAADGSFSFEGIDPTVPAQLEPLVVFQDIPYFGDLEAAITLSPDQPTANVDVTVYETTDDPTNIRIERLHLVFDLTPGQAQVAELYILSNDGDRTYVGTLEQGTLPLSVPPNALSFQPGGNPDRYLTLADGIADTIPIPPGESTAESVLVYNLAYGGDLELSRPLPFAASKVNIFVSANSGIQIRGDQVQPGAPFQAQGTLLDTYLADNLSAGEDLTLRLSGEFEGGNEAATASPHQAPGPSETQSIVIGSIFLVGTLALVVFYWQGRLSLTRVPTTDDHQSDLLHAIADLDDDYEAGRMPEKRYHSQRAELKKELMELMENER